MLCPQTHQKTIYHQSLRGRNYLCKKFVSRNRWLFPATPMNSINSPPYNLRLRTSWDVFTIDFDSARSSDYKQRPDSLYTSLTLCFLSIAESHCPCPSSRQTKHLPSRYPVLFSPPPLGAVKLFLFFSPIEPI